VRQFAAAQVLDLAEQGLRLDRAGRQELRKVNFRRIDFGELVDGQLALVAVIGGLGAHLHDLPGAEAGVRLRERAPDLGLHLSARILQHQAPIRPVARLAGSGLAQKKVILYRLSWANVPYVHGFRYHGLANSLMLGYCACTAPCGGQEVPCAASFALKGRGLSNRTAAECFKAATT